MNLSACISKLFLKGRRELNCCDNLELHQICAAGQDVDIAHRRRSAIFLPKRSSMIPASCRLRKHADYQRVYSASRKQFAKQMSYFFALRAPAGADGLQLPNAEPEGARVGLTVGKVMGKAVDRNRIKRRMREAIRRQLPLLRMPVDVVLHPRRSVIELDLPTLEREVGWVFRAIQKSCLQTAARPTAEG